MAVHAEFRVSPGQLYLLADNESIRDSPWGTCLLEQVQDLLELLSPGFLEHLVDEHLGRRYRRAVVAHPRQSYRFVLTRSRADRVGDDVHAEERHEAQCSLGNADVALDPADNHRLRVEVDQSLHEAGHLVGIEVELHDRLEILYLVGERRNGGAELLLLGHQDRKPHDVGEANKLQGIVEYLLLLVDDVQQLLLDVHDDQHTVAALHEPALSEKDSPVGVPTVSIMLT